MTKIIDTRLQPELTFFPETEEDEIVQHIYVILQSVKNSIPCYRDFGLDNEFLHRPLLVARQFYAVTVADALRKYEPRVEIISFDFGVDESDPSSVYARLEVVFNGEV